MSSQRVINASGLWTSPSPLTAPAGSYLVADNCVINSPNVIESRRGFEWLSYILTGSGAATDLYKAAFSYRGVLLVFSQHLTNTPTLDTGTLAHNTGVSMANYPPNIVSGGPNTRPRGLEASLSFFLTSRDGVLALDSPVSTTGPVLSGIPKGPTPTTIAHPTQITGAPDAGWMPTNTQTSYVATWFKIDTNEVDHEGEPSTPIFVINAADLTIGVGNAHKIGGSSLVIVDAPANNLFVGDSITVATGGDPNFASGTFTVTAVSDTQFRYDDGLVVGSMQNNANPISVTSGFKNVSVSFNIPFEIDATYTCLVYRTLLSTGANVQPRAQYYLDKEIPITSAEKTAGFVTYTDIFPDALLQDPLYTNTDDGEPPDSSLDNDNSRPPQASDIENFDGRLWGCNFAEYTTFPMALLGTGAPNGLQPGDTLSLSGLVTPLFPSGISETYTAVSEGAFAGPFDFHVYTSSVSAGENVARTAQEIALAITASSQGFDCYYTGPTSANDVFVGSILIRTKTVSKTSSFFVLVNRQSAWNPATIPPIVNPTVQPNGLWFSKQNQSQAVPLLNRLQVGPKGSTILRIKALRDKLFVFTDIAGTFIVSNNYPYQITLLDTTAQLVAPDTLVNFDSAIYALTSQGVVRFNESGPVIISVPIEASIKALFGTGINTLKKSALAVGYESYRKYILAMPTLPSDTSNTQAFVYDAVTKSWTRWTKPMDSLVVVPQTDLLWCTAPAAPQVNFERKNFDRTDYSDPSYAITVVSFTGVTLDVISLSIPPQVGDLLYQDPISRSLITDVVAGGPGAYTLTVQDTVLWAVGPATGLPGVQNNVLYTQIFTGAPEQRKNFREVSYHYRTTGFTLGDAVFTSETNPALFLVPIVIGGYGQQNWGHFAWEQPARTFNKRVNIPVECRRTAFMSPGFSIREAQAQWQLLGVTPVFEQMSERNSF